MPSENFLQRGRFITIEGIEGVGKSSALKFLNGFFEQIKIPVLATREPGGTLLGEEIRKIVLTPHSEPLQLDTELLLMFSCRAQHLALVIRPALARGEWVLCDRFTDASYAYQGGGRGISSDRIAVLEKWLHADLNPDLTLLLIAPVRVALQRAKQRGKLDRIESEQEDFFNRVQQVYLDRAGQYPNRYRIIDVDRPLIAVQEEIKLVINTYVDSLRS